MRTFNQILQELIEQGDKANMKRADYNVVNQSLSNMITMGLASKFDIETEQYIPYNAEDIDFSTDEDDAYQIVVQQGYGAPLLVCNYSWHAEYRDCYVNLQLGAPSEGGTLEMYTNINLYTDGRLKLADEIERPAPKMI